MTTNLEKYLEQGIWLSKMPDHAAWGLVDLIRDLGPNVKGIEIGVQLGMNSYMLLDACPNITKIIGVDPYEPYTDWDRSITQSDQDIIYAEFMENLPLMKDRFELLKYKSVDASVYLEDDSYDFLFVDGDHSIRGVLNDLDKYVPKIKKGGIVAGHDIGLHGVNMAVQGWCRRKNIDSKKVMITENQAWYWIKE